MGLCKKELGSDTQNGYTLNYYGPRGAKLVSMMNQSVGGIALKYYLVSMKEGWQGLQRCGEKNQWLAIEMFYQ